MKASEAEQSGHEETSRTGPEPDHEALSQGGEPPAGLLLGFLHGIHLISGYHRCRLNHSLQEWDDRAYMNAPYGWGVHPFAYLFVLMLDTEVTFKIFLREWKKRLVRESSHLDAVSKVTRNSEKEADSTFIQAFKSLDKDYPSMSIGDDRDHVLRLTKGA